MRETIRLFKNIIFSAILIGLVITVNSCSDENQELIVVENKKKTMFPPAFDFIECIDLFNILNAEISGQARISDANYLYLLGLYSFFENVLHIHTESSLRLSIT